MTFATVTLTLWLLCQSSLELPTNARKGLDHKFPGWKLLEYTEEYYGGQLVELDRHSSPFFKCQLNHDSVADYALGIVIKGDTNLTVHFVALVSEEDSFSVHTLRSYINPHPLLMYLYLYPKETETANFGWDQEADIPAELRGTFNERKMTSKFSTDCVALFRTDKNYCMAFVFEKGKLWSFSSCD